MAPLKNSATQKGNESPLGMETGALGGPAGLLLLALSLRTGVLTLSAPQRPGM